MTNKNNQIRVQETKIKFVIEKRVRKINERKSASNSDRRLNGSFRTSGPRIIESLIERSQIIY